MRESLRGAGQAAIQLNGMWMLYNGMLYGCSTNRHVRAHHTHTHCVCLYVCIMGGDWGGKVTRSKPDGRTRQILQKADFGHAVQVVGQRKRQQW